MESKDKDNKTLSALSHYKCYTIEEQKIIVQNPERKPQGLGKSYNKPKNLKKLTWLRKMRNQD